MVCGVFTHEVNHMASGIFKHIRRRDQVSPRDQVVDPDQVSPRDQVSNLDGQAEVSPRPGRGSPARNGTANPVQGTMGAERVRLVDASDWGDVKRLTELMWLMPMLIGNAVHGNADNPPVPMGPMGAYDLDSADEQQDRDEVS